MTDTICLVDPDTVSLADPDTINLTCTTTGGGLGRRGPYRVRVEGTVELLLDDDEIVIVFGA